MHPAVRFRRIIQAVVLVSAPIFSVASGYAQIDVSGDWTAPVTFDNNEDVVYGNYTGVPLGEAGRLRARTWNESMLEQPQWQCKPHGAVYFERGPGARLHIQREYNPITGQLMALTLGPGGTSPSGGMEIFLDGRQEPSDLALHSWFGFSKGSFEGGHLKFTTNHIKEDTLRRLGVPSSDRTTLTQFWIRHGDHLEWLVIDDDPVYFTEPMLRSMDFKLVLNAGFNAPGPAPVSGCVVVEESDRPAGTVPHYNPKEDKQANEYADRYHLPLEFTMGGAKTMYPEYQRQLIRAANQPKK
jgi:hypothetical protein